MDHVLIGTCGLVDPVLVDPLTADFDDGSCVKWDVAWLVMFRSIPMHGGVEWLSLYTEWLIILVDLLFSRCYGGQGSFG